MGTSVRSTPSLVVREQRGAPQITMAELGLKKKEIDAIEFAFDVYDFKGDGNVDAFYAGDLIRACNLNPTLKTINEVGGQAERERRCSPRLRSIPCAKLARIPRTRVDSTTSLKSLSFMTKMTTTPSLRMSCSSF